MIYSVSLYQNTLITIFMCSRHQRMCVADTGDSKGHPGGLQRTVKWTPLNAAGRLASSALMEGAPNTPLASCCHKPRTAVRRYRSLLCAGVAIQLVFGICVQQYGKRNAIQLYDIVEQKYSLQGNNFTEKGNSRVFSNDDQFTLMDTTEQYFVNVSDTITCYKHGTDFPRTEKVLLNYTNNRNLNGSNTAGINENNITVNEKEKETACICLPGYYGTDCGIPDAVWQSRYRTPDFRHLLRRRDVPRRVINGLPLLKEKTLLEARVHDLTGAVDLFLLAESNYTAHGDPKQLYILDKLNSGFLKEFHDKILHVFVGFFPSEGKADSWKADRYLREFMGKWGIPRISGIREDDLFILNDADEIPSKPLVMFLKLYDGYTVPVALSMRWSIYGFFWKSMGPTNALAQLLNLPSELTTTVYAVATMGLIKNVMDYNPFLIRDVPKLEVNAKYQQMQELHPNEIGMWTAGSSRHYAGWHCSWCFSPEGIVLKLDSAQAGDPPRWGDYPEKHDTTYLKGLIREGTWFDGSNNMFLADPTEPDYAPPYLLSHAQQFAEILFHPKQRLKYNMAAYSNKLLETERPLGTQTQNKSTVVNES